MNVKQMFANAVIRKVAYTLVALVFGLIASLFSSKAHAQSDTITHADQGAALAACKAEAASKLPWTHPNNGNLQRIACDASNVGGATCRDIGGGYDIFGVNKEGNDQGGSCYDLRGYVPDLHLHAWEAGSSCANRPKLAANTVLGSDKLCNNGCAFEMDAAVTVCLGEGAKMYCYSPQWKPVGGVCTDGIPGALDKPHDPTNETCRATGANYKECVKPDGQHCVTGAKGSVLCWQPGETGTRQTADGSLAAARAIAPATPAVSTAIENPTTVATTTTTINNTTYNTVTATGTGSSGGQPNLGTGGRTGNGTGTSDGTGQGTGDGDGEGEGDGDGNAGSGLGEFYEGTDDTAESVMSEFYNEVTNTPIIDSVTDFMSVGGVGGSCPTFNLPASQFWDSMTVDQHCSGAINTLLLAIGWVIFAYACYRAVLLAMT